MGVVSVVSSPYYEPRSTGLNTRRSRRDHARVEMAGERSKLDCAKERKGKQRDTAPEESKAKEKDSDRLRKKRVYRESLESHFT